MYAVNQYDAIAESYDSLFKDEVSIEENNKIASMLFDVPGIILDVGCGTGLFLDILKVSPDEYFGIDPSNKMLEVFRKKHPRYYNLCIPFEMFNLKFMVFNTVVALFGSASYIEIEALTDIPEEKNLFLMFYKETYHPVTYERSGCELEYYEHSRCELEQSFPHCEVKEFGNYYIVTNV